MKPTKKNKKVLIKLNFQDIEVKGRSNNELPGGYFENMCFSVKTVAVEGGMFAAS